MRKLYFLPFWVVLSVNIAYAKRPILLGGPRELLQWFSWGVSPIGSSMLSIFLGFFGSIVVAIALKLKGVSLKGFAKCLVLSMFSCILPGLVYLLALCLGAYYESKTSSPFLFDFVTNYYPSALLLGMLGAFIRGLYAFRGGLGLRKAIRYGIAYWVIIFFILIVVLYIMNPAELESLGSGLLLFAILPASVGGLLNGIYHFSKFSNFHRALKEGLWFFALIWIGIIGAFYREKVEIAADTFSAYRSFLVPLCTLFVFFLVSQLYLNPNFFTNTSKDG
ncbi:hypothetical protein H5T87_07525 [bacterium]|nr:hypothetical protein [bacterium]